MSGFEAVVTATEKGSLVILSGTVNRAAKEGMEAAYEKAGAIEGEILLDFRNVEYINSTGIAVIVGLSFATVLTLILVPVLYSLVDDLTDFFRRHFAHPVEAEEEGPYAEPYEPAAARAPVGEREPVMVREDLRPAEG